MFDRDPRGVPQPGIGVAQIGPRRVDRRGKAIVIALEGPGESDRLVVHLGMTGRLEWTRHARDRGDKLAAYRIIPSLREVLLIDQAAVAVERWRRLDETSWTSESITALGDVLMLAAAPVELPLREVYREVFDSPA